MRIDIMDVNNNNNKIGINPLYKLTLKKNSLSFIEEKVSYILFRNFIGTRLKYC